MIEAKAIEQKEKLDLLEQSNESVAKSVDESMDKSVDETVEKSVDESVEKSVNETVDRMLDISTNESETQVHCPACRNGDAPTEAHSCVVCKKFVHIFDECSKSMGNEEGFGQKRICLTCYVTDDIDTILEWNTFDNWKNLGKTNQRIHRNNLKNPNERKKKKSLYLGESKSIIKDRISIEKHKAIPIIKNGN